MSNRALYEAVRKIEGVSDEEARAAAESVETNPETATRADVERAECDLRADLARTETNLREELASKADLERTEARLRADLASKADLEQTEARLRADLASKNDVERAETNIRTELDLFRSDIQVSVERFQRTIESAVSGIEIRCLKWNVGALVALGGIFAFVVKYT